MFGIGAPELVVILVVGLIFVGPDKLPKVAKTIGAALRDLRRAANLAQAELKETVDDLIREADLADAINEQPRERPPPEPEEDPLPPMDWELGDPTAATDDPGIDYSEDDAVEGDDASPELHAGNSVEGAHDTNDDTAGDAADPVEEIAAAAQPVAQPSERDANRHPDPGFTFDDDPDDWDPDDWDDSAEPEDIAAPQQASTVAAAPPDEPVPAAEASAAVAAVDAAVAAHHSSLAREVTPGPPDIPVSPETAGSDEWDPGALGDDNDTDPQIPAFASDEPAMTAPIVAPPIVAPPVAGPPPSAPPTSLPPPSASSKAGPIPTEPPPGPAGTLPRSMPPMRSPPPANPDETP